MGKDSAELYKKYQRWINCKEFETEEEYKIAQQFLESVDEVTQEVNDLKNKWIQESVKDTKSIIESKFTKTQLKEMDKYIKQTEFLIFQSFMSKPEFETRKVFQREFHKAMIIRKDEFLKKYGITLEYVEAYNTTYL